MRKETDSRPVAVPRRGRGRHRFPERVTPSPQRALGVGSSAGVRNGVHRIFRVPQRASPMPSRWQLLHRNVTKESGLESVSGMEKAFSERGQDHAVHLNDCVNEAQIRPR